MRFLKLLVAAPLLLPVCSFADTTINFEQYTQGTQITNQYSGVTFTNADQLVAPNYAYGFYPPHSGNGVVSDYPGTPMTLDFTSAQSLVTGWYTAGVGITVDAYDSSHNLVTTFDLASNYGSNAMFSVSGSGITEIVLNDDSGYSNFFTIDDLTYSASVAATPEPGSLALLGTGVLGLMGTARRRGSVS